MDESARYTGLILASAPLLIPKGQTTSLMDTETTDLYSITGTLGTRLPDTRRYFHTVCKNKHMDIFTTRRLFMQPAAHLCSEAGKCTVLSALELFAACEGSEN